MEKIIALIFSTLVFYSCITTGYMVKDDVNKFENYTSHTLSFNKVKEDFDAFINFNIRQTTSQGNTFYEAIINYKAENWCFIPDGESVILLVDNEKMVLSGKGSIDSRNSNSMFVEELAHYFLSVENFKKLASASSIEMQLRCAQKKYQIKFGPDSIKNINRFYTEYVEGKKSE